MKRRRRQRRGQESTSLAGPQQSTESQNGSDGRYEYTISSTESGGSVAAVPCVWTNVDAPEAATRLPRARPSTSLPIQQPRCRRDGRLSGQGHDARQNDSQEMPATYFFWPAALRSASAWLSAVCASVVALALGSSA